MKTFPIVCIQVILYNIVIAVFFGVPVVPKQEGSVVGTNKRSTGFYFKGSFS